ncbi:MAG: beta-lactamase [Frankiales bacterium]|nr:beta-lactamase [Frankiales bacterium]
MVGSVSTEAVGVRVRDLLLGVEDLRAAQFPVWFDPGFLQALPEAKVAAAFEEVRDSLGESPSVEAYQVHPRWVSMALAGAADTWLITVTVSDEPANLVIGLRMIPLPKDAVLWEDLVAAPLEAELDTLDAGISARIGLLMTEARSGDRVLGLAVAVALSGTPIFSAGVGLASLEPPTAPSSQTVWRAGSITKPVTALALLDVASEGLIDLDRPAADYLTSVPLQPLVGCAPPTIRHLLTHTSGLPRHAPGPRRSPLRLREALTAGISPTRAPGEVNEYSNLGYGLLGLLLEDVTGESYAACVQRRVFDPLEMVSSSISPDPPTAAAAAACFEAELDWIMPAQPDSVAEIAAGALASTTFDLLRLGHGVLGTPAMWERQVAVGAPDGGLGLALTERGGKLLGWHNGGISGGKAMLLISPADDIVVAVQANGHPAKLETLAIQILEAIVSPTLPEAAPHQP